jgi:hypothetical protein
MNEQQEGFFNLGRAADASMKSVRDSMDRMEEAVYRQICRYLATQNDLSASISRVYNDYLWTLNLRYVEAIMRGVIVAVRLCEEKFSMGFGGMDPRDDQFGMYPIKSGDTEHHSIGPDEALLITGFRMKNGHDNLKLISMAFSFGRNKLGPLVPINNGGTTVLLPMPCIIEPRSNFSIDKATFYDRIEDRAVENDGSYVEPIGYWFTSKAKMIERR